MLIFFRPQNDEVTKCVTVTMETLSGNLDFSCSTDTRHVWLSDYV